MACIAVLLTLLSLLLSLLSGWLTITTHDQWWFGFFLIAVALLQLTRCLPTTRLHCMAGTVIVVLILALLATYVVPRSWISLEDWQRIFTDASYTQPFYLLRPPILALMALCMATFSTLLPIHHRHARLILVLMGAVLALLYLSTGSSSANELQPTTPAGFNVALMLLILAQACVLPGELWQLRKLLLAPIVISMVVLSGTLFAWHYQNQQNLHDMDTFTHTLSDNVTERLGQTLHAQQQAMWRFASFWGLFNRAPSHTEWARQAQEIVNDFNYIKRIVYIAPDGRAARTYPSENNTRLIGHNLYDLVDNEPLRQALVYGESSATQTTDLPEGGRGIIYYMPVTGLNSGRIPGAIAYFVEPTALFETQRGYIAKEQIGLTASEHSNTFFRIRPTQHLSQGKYCNLLAVGDDALTVCIRPALSRLYEQRSFLPDVTLVLGLVLTYLFYSMMYFFLRLRHEHVQLQHANRNLSDEINKRIALQREVEWLARHDELTKLPNRRYFMERVQAYHDELPLTVMIIDLDYFKSINDRLGHQEGDRYLKEVASAARVPIEDHPGILARYGGEEFIACLPHCSLTQAKILAEQIRRDIIALDLFQPETGDTVTVSIGIATTHELRHDLATLVLEADQALYSAKRSGRNRVEYSV
ncbi:sensor domain-containing diguanylate cyclase [Phytohalomonas tamaricis]|uniref:sensor domain-containing diguanylate cyclase n=1 Tax=Phytohalomonas tamaricis TaxID=2081032 RepID=UPI001319CDA6|nr:sensor domain-containing diguanylate cyclase [Phytohalomonas tamaricis]